MDLNKEYLTDEKKEEEGVWEDFGNGCEVLIASASNQKYEDYLTEVTKPYLKQMRRGTFPKEKLKKITIKAMAKHIVLGWKHLFIGKKEIKYSEENAIMVLTKFKRFREDVSDFAQAIDGYKAEGEEIDKENLSDTSNGG